MKNQTNMIIRIKKNKFIKIDSIINTGWCVIIYIGNYWYILKNLILKTIATIDDILLEK